MMRAPRYSAQYNDGYAAGRKGGKKNGKQRGRIAGNVAAKQNAVSLAKHSCTLEFCKGYEAGYAYYYAVAWRKAFDKVLWCVFGWDSQDRT